MRVRAVACPSWTRERATVAETGTEHEGAPCTCGPSSDAFLPLPFLPPFFPFFGIPPPRTQPLSQLRSTQLFQEAVWLNEKSVEGTRECGNLDAINVGL